MIAGFAKPLQEHVGELRIYMDLLTEGLAKASDVNRIHPSWSRLGGLNLLKYRLWAVS